MTADNGLTVEAVGLNKAVRGQKIDWARPDLIILDDVDAKHDTEAAVKKKVETITTSILPAAAPHAAIMFLQNLIHRQSIATSLAKQPNEEGSAQFLTDRIINGPHKAVEGLVYELQITGEGEFRWGITAGRSLWRGFDLAVCEAEINKVGPDAFELESQHEVDSDMPGALLTTAVLDAARVSSHPDLITVAVGVDPTGGAGQVGIIAGGVAMVGREKHGYTIADHSTPPGTGASVWAIAVLKCYNAVGADMILVEDNFGGDMVENTIRTAKLEDEVTGKVLVDGRIVPIVRVHASRGKEVRAQPVASLFQTALWHHVGRFTELQKQWTQWMPGTKPSPDRLDAEVWVATHLLVGELPEPKIRQAHVRGRPVSGNRTNRKATVRKAVR
jgi:hypothetical protein